MDGVEEVELLELLIVLELVLVVELPVLVVVADTVEDKVREGEAVAPMTWNCAPKFEVTESATLMA